MATKTKKVSKTKELVEMINGIAKSVTIGYNKDIFGEDGEEDKSHRVVVAIGTHGRRLSLWKFNSSNEISNYIYLQELDNNIVSAVMEAHSHFPKLPIYIEKDEAYERSRNEKWKFLTFGKYAGLHIDDILENDITYAKELIGSFTYKKGKINKSLYNKSYNGVIYRFKMPTKYKTDKLVNYVLESKNKVLKKWDEIKQEESKKVADKNKKLFIGTVGKIFDFELKINNITKHTNHNIYTLSDKSGNTVVKKGYINSRFISKKGYKDSKYLRKGDWVKFKAIVEKHIVDAIHVFGNRVTYITGDITDLNSKNKKKKTS